MLVYILIYFMLGSNLLLWEDAVVNLGFAFLPGRASSIVGKEWDCHSVPSPAGHHQVLLPSGFSSLQRTD